MLLLMLVPVVWGVLQLCVLGSLGRTVRLSTALGGIAAGMYACGLVAVLLELVSTSIYAAVADVSHYDALQVMSYTVDPVIEEVVKIAPLALVWLAFRRLARGLGLVDHLVLGAALGAGFGLLEATMRYATVHNIAIPSDSGYIVTASLGGTVTVPGVWESLTSWLPAPTVTAELFGDLIGGPTHLMWSALAGVGIGFVATHRGRTRWLGLAPLVWVCYEHCLYNYQAANDEAGGVLAAISNFLAARGTLLVLLALLGATVLDRIRVHRMAAVHPGVLLPGEVAGRPLGGPLLRISTMALPWTALVTTRFARARRSALYASAAAPNRADAIDAAPNEPGPIGAAPTDAAPNDPPALLAAVAQTRDKLAVARDPAAWRRATAGLRPGPAIRSLLRGRRLVLVVVWLVVLAAPLLYFVIGGFPGTKGVQHALAGTVGTVVLSVLGVLSLAMLAWSSVRCARLLTRARRAGVTERAVAAMLRLCTGVGALLAGCYLLFGVLRGAAGDDSLYSAHVLDALGSLLFVAGLALFIAGLFLFPPFGLAVAADGVLVGGLTLSSELAATTALSGVLAGLGVVLNEAASDGGGDSGGDGSSGDGGDVPSARQQRLDELARDPADGGKITPDTRAEADVALNLEERGELSGVRRSPDPEADFIEASGRRWDVKAFRSQVPGRKGAFRLDKALTKINDKLRKGIDVILDTRQMTPEHIAELRQGLDQLPGAAGRVLWYP